MDNNQVISKANLIWNIADLITGTYKPHEYGNVILPMTVLKRFDSVLAPTKDEVLKVNKNFPNNQFKDQALKNASGVDFYNTSQYTFETLLNAPDSIEDNFREYINGFSENVRKIIEKFKFDNEITTLAEKKHLFAIIKEFNKPEADLHPDIVTNHDMGYIFEEIIRQFSEQSNESAGQHFTPREVVKLGAQLLTIEDSEVLSSPGAVRTVADAACGTGGMLSETMNLITSMNNSARVIPFGNEINDQTFAICQADMLMKGHDIDNIYNLNTLTDNPLKNKEFDYIIMNPPFGRPYKQFKSEIDREREKDGAVGRYAPGLPKVSDSQMLFLETAISYMKSPEDGGSRVAIIHNGSPLFNGDAGSGPSEIRRYILENDLLEAIIALPTNIFYNTGIPTYFWILSNKKAGTKREGKVQLIDASKIFTPRRKNLGDKRVDISDKQIEQIIKEYSDFKETEITKIFDNEDFGYTEVTVQKPVLDENGEIVVKRKKPVFEKGFSDKEQIPLKEDIEDYLDREVRPYIPKAMIDEKKSKVGYTIPFTRYFYKYKEPIPSEELERQFLKLEKSVNDRISKLFGDKL